MRAFVFPGQGSQSVGMGRELAAASAAARAVFQEVDDTLGQALFRLMVDGPENELTLTTNAQPAIMANAIATLRVLTGAKPVDAGPAERVLGAAWAHLESRILAPAWGATLDSLSTD